MTPTIITILLQQVTDKLTREHLACKASNIATIADDAKSVTPKRFPRFARVPRPDTSPDVC